MSDNIDVKVNVDTTGAQASLAKLNKAVDSLAKNFNGMKTAAVGAGFVAMMGYSMRLADDLQDLSNSTGIATGTLVELKKALAVTGGEADMMPAAINKFIMSIDEAAQGSIKAQNSFKDVGVTLDDLRKLGEKELMLKTLDGIAAIDDAGRRATLMMEKFGKSFRTVDPGELATKLRETAGEGDKYANAIKRAAELNDTLATAQSNLSLAVLMAFEPMLKKINSFNVAMEDSGIKAEGVINVIKTLGVVLAASFALNFGLRLVATIGQIGRAFTSMSSAGAGAMSGLFAATGHLMVRIRGLVALFATVGTGVYMASQLFDDFGDVAVNAIARIVEGIGSLSGMLAGGTLGAAFGSAFGPIGTLVGGIAGGFAGDKLAELFGLNKLIEKAKTAREEAEKAQEYAKKIGGGRGVVNPDVVKPAKDAGRDVDTKARSNAISQLQDMTNEYAKQQAMVQMRIGLEADLLGKGAEEIQQRQAQLDLSQAYIALTDGLIKKREQLTKDEEYLIPVINQQLAAAQKLYNAQTEGLTNVIKKNQEAQAIENLRLFTLKSQIDSSNELVKIQDEMAKLTLTDIEKKYFDIEAASKASALAAIQAEEARRGGIKLSADEQQKYFDAASTGVQKLQEETKKLHDRSREFSVGWTQAFNEYADSATNAANRAKDIFNSVTNNMNSAIDNFVETGKFSMSDFASSVIKDLIKIELKAATMNLWKTMGGGGGGGGGGGILSSIGSFLGFAEGGNPPIGKASIVGENGPELIVPRTASTVIPNGAGGQVSNTYITNNISAIDAKSVQQLFAENRRSLLGSVEAARREMPGRR